MHLRSAPQVPRPEQPLVHVAIEQSSDAQPSRHWQLPSSVQTPWAEQPFGHERCSHAEPYEPPSQMHVPLRHPPRSWQLEVHASSVHAGPIQPKSQLHCPSRHRPRPLQSDGQRRMPQSGAPKPGRQVHVPVTRSQNPWPEHPSPGQVRRLQSTPAWSASHRQVPSTHLPWEEHAWGHALSAHAGPS